MKKPSKSEIHEEWDAKMRAEYFDPIERFPEKINQLLNALNRVCFIYIIALYVYCCCIFLALYDTKNWRIKNLRNTSLAIHFFDHSQSKKMDEL